MAELMGEMPSLEMRPADDSAGEKSEDTFDLLTKDFDRLKKQKVRPTGGVEGETLTNLCFLNDEPYTDYKNSTLSLEAQDANKLYLSFNLIKPRYQKLMGRLSAFNAPFKARPDRKDPQAIEDAEVVDRMIVATDEKVDEPSRLREIFHWLLTGGTTVVHTPWVPNASIEPSPQYSENGELLYTHSATGAQVPESQMTEAINGGVAAPEEFEIYEAVETVGEVGCEVFGPFNVFIDASVRSIADLSPDQWVHLAQIKTVGWVAENFQVEVKPQTELTLISSKINPDTGSSVGGTYLKDLIPMVQGTASDTDPPMVLYIQSYQPASQTHPQGRYVCWIPGDKVLHEDVCPYEEIPFVDIHFAPVTTSFWTKAYMSPLVSPQRFINKRMSQLGEQSNATLYSNLLLGTGVSEEDIPTDKPGVIKGGLNENGSPNVARMPPPEIPQWFLESISLAMKMFNDLAGGADLMEENKFPGQLRGPNAVPMLQEILDTQWGPLFHHIAERLARVKQMRLNRVKQFYPPLRTMHYTDRNQRDEVMTFHTEEVLRSGTNFNITVERGSIMPELRALREARLTERLNGPLRVLYLDERTGMPDKGKIAADLQFGDVGREGRESRYRKLAQERVKMLWEGKQIPPVQPFYDHKSMLDELEDSMATTEFMKASPKIQQLFGAEWQQHSDFLAREAQMRQMADQSHMVHQAVAQATQQAAAQAASDAVHEAMAQVHAQREQPTSQYVASAEAHAQGRPGPGAPPPRPGSQAPSGAGDSKPRRKVTIEER